ncbi:MAG: ATP-binding protein [Planctomycetes bacterium]|nr:ATP-binding protein [Planctomycetota bacterium]
MPVVPFDQALPHRIVIASDLHAARQVEEQVLRLTEAKGYSKECAFAIRLSLEEALVNAHRHGNRCDAAKKITVSFRIDRRRAVIRVSDEGSGFDPCCVPDPTCPERICLPNGRGIMLMRSYLDEVTYSPRGNEVQLVKERC